MHSRTLITRWLVTLFLAASLLFGALGASLSRVSAAPQAEVNQPVLEDLSVGESPLQANTLHVVISEFRFVGPEGANDEFIELFNPTNSPVNISGWKIFRSNNAGSPTLQVTLGSATLQPGQYFLIVNPGASAGLLALQNAVFLSSTGITEDGGIGLTLSDGTTIVDAVGLSAGSAYKEGTTLLPLSGSANQSYERKTSGNVGNCNDTDNNAGDFVWNSSTSNPQNLSSAPLPCITVTNVTSSLDSPPTYVLGNLIDITLTFSAPVNVTGAPTLLLETGATDRTATYVSGSGTNTLTFNYTVMAGDVSNDLDYVDTDSLSLNGGTITGAIGNATLILPVPSTAGSLGLNRALVINSSANPSIISIKHQVPLASSTTADILVFRVTFSETVIGVDTSDFVVHNNFPDPNTTALVSNATTISSSVYDITVSGGNLAGFNGVVGLDLNGTGITDVVLNPILLAEPATDEIYSVDNISPSVALNQTMLQPDPAIDPGGGVPPVNFDVVFSEPINVGTFTTTDITQNGTALGIIWSITDSGNHMNFILSSTSSGNGTLIPSITANRVTDVAGNNNIASTSVDNSVLVSDTLPPTVTVNQAVAQADPTTALPIKFAVVFSEPINVITFTPSDITQSGTATGITWGIVDSGDHKNFTLSATSSGFGTVIPSIAENRVTDPGGNNNTASTSGDNMVIFAPVPPTATSLPVTVDSVVINEVAWMGTVASANDEWIELYNNTASVIDLTNWQIRTATQTGSTILITIKNCQPINLNCTIAPHTYFLIEREDDNSVRGINSDQVVTWTLLPNSGTAGTILLLCSPYNVSSNTCNTHNASHPVDEANRNGGVWPAGSASTYGSMERKYFNSDDDIYWLTHTGAAPQCGHDANWNGTTASANLIKGTPKCANWALNVTATPRSTATPTRTRTPVPQPLPYLVINEFLARPGHDWNNDGLVNNGDEFIEVMNAGVVNLNLSAYKLDDEKDLGSKPFALPSQTLKPGEKAIFYASQTSISLSDAGDSVRLLKSNEVVADAYTYPILKSVDISYCRLTDGYGDWVPRCFPTPGLPNALAGSLPLLPNAPNGSACLLPDTTPREFVQAECMDAGLQIWNPAYWNAGNGDEIWFSEEFGKWTVVYQ